MTSDELDHLAELADDVQLRPWHTVVVLNGLNDVMGPEGMVLADVRPRDAEYITKLINAAPDLLGLARDGLRMREIERHEEVQRRAGRD